MPFKNSTFFFVVFSGVGCLTGENDKEMETQEQKFTRIVEEYKRTIYTVCYMFSKDEDEVNDLKSRMMMDITSVPMIVIICNAIGWSMLFAAAVSVWAILDLISVLWMKKRFNNQNLLDSDVLTVAKNVKEYKKFYHLSTVIGAIPAVAMTAYIIIRIYSQGVSGNDMQWLIALLIVTYLIAVVVTVRKYRKLMTSCDSLIDSPEKM